MKLDKIDMDSIYKDLQLDKIPWNIESPPQALVDLVEREIIKPCKTIDLGCGTGHYAIYLTSLGFEVTGIDISPTAIEIAKENAEKKGIACQFLVADVTGDFHEIKETFDFAYDWQLLHHILPEKRNKYCENVKKILNPGGKFLSVGFSEKDPQFGGSGKFRKTRLGTVLYFSSEDELRTLFQRYFQIEELKTVEIYGKFGSHQTVYAFLSVI